jgi:type I restriction enzyme M protein
MTTIKMPTAAKPAVTGNGKQFSTFSELSSFLWGIADLLRGDFKAHDFGKVILPFTVLRRLDCVLDETKVAVLSKYEAAKGGAIQNLDPILNKVTGRPFHNVSKLDVKKLLDDPNNIAKNLTGYIKGFSENVREIFIDRFKFQEQVEKLDSGNILFMVVKRFAEVDLHPDVVDNHTMGLVFEDLIRRFAQQSNETAGEHFTPREVIRLMVNLLFNEDKDVLTKPGVVRTLFDPACGTGGMLSVAEEYLRELNPKAELKVFGQELNDETFAICQADMLIKGQATENIRPGNSFSQDGHAGSKFDYMISNPPYGVEWKKVEKVVTDEAESQGFAGRFGAGLPRINDGSLLFVQHMLSKMKAPKDGGGRIAIVLNGSPLFSGDAGSGESEIRRWIVENDWLEAIVALPDNMFFNTDISTYIWVLTNRKPVERKGKVQLINGIGFYEKMKKSLGEKRQQLSEAHIAELSRIFGDFEESKVSKVFDNEDFGYRKIVIERPLRLNFQASPERIARLDGETAFVNLTKTGKKGSAAEAEHAEGVALQQAIKGALLSFGTKLYKSRGAFEGDIKAACKRSGLKLAANIEKAVVSALAETDETADVCTDKKGNPEPDADLRDTETVPRAYFEREVKPHVADAWIDEGKTKVGYEISFARLFYEFVPPRPLIDIDREIRSDEVELRRLLSEILA